MRVRSTLRWVDLTEVVTTRGRVEGDLVKVDDFLNHRVDPEVIAAVGAEIAKRYAADAPDVILTAEASGIPPALATALELGIPTVYAKKYLGVGDRYTYAREVTSPTKGVEYRVEVARRALSPGHRVLVVDDFLSGGRTAEALGEIAGEAGCSLVGFAFVIEKAWMDGRRRLAAHGWPVHSLVVVRGIDNGRIEIEGHQRAGA